MRELAAGLFRVLIRSCVAFRGGLSDGEVFSEILRMHPDRTATRTDSMTI